MEKEFREVVADIKEGEVWETLSKRVELVNGAIYISRINGNKFDDYVLTFTDVCKYKLKS